MPNLLVIKFQQIAATTAVKTTSKEMTAGPINSLPIVVATVTPNKNGAIDSHTRGQG